MTTRPNSTTRPAPATAKSLTSKTLSAAPRAVRTPVPAPARAAKRSLSTPAETSSTTDTDASRVLDLTDLLTPSLAEKEEAPTAPKRKAASKAASPKAADKASQAVAVPKSESSTPSLVLVEAAVTEEDAPPSQVASESPPSIETPTAIARPRAIKRRSPADLAGQYAREEKAKRAPVAVPVEETKTVLRGKAAREAKEQRRQVMAVNDAVLQRLRNTAATSSLVLTVPDGPDDVPVKKGRGYEVECGKCGTLRKFSTPATLCARCGTILVKA